MRNSIRREIGIGFLMVLSCAVAARAQTSGAIIGWGIRVSLGPEQLSNLVAVAGGGSHSLGLKADGGVHGATENWTTDTHWLTCWKGIAPTAWLYFAVSGSPFVEAPNVLYVDGSATGAFHDGSTWCNAFVSLQDALATAANSNGVITEIRVADGIYSPDQGEHQTAGDREATFQLLSGVALRGGYAGCGTPNPDRRDIEANPTILSGDLNGDDLPVACAQDSPDCDSFGRLCGNDGFCIISDNNVENSFHVVTGSGTDATCVLEGFRITAGNANGTNPNYVGGGMFNLSGNPTVTNCTFTGNLATFDGAGMFNANNSSPSVTNCTFSGNSARYGGGISNQASSSPTVSNCTFSGNSAGDGGGGMDSFSNSNPTVSKCTFSGNTADIGGGMDNFNNSNPTMTDCTFTGNLATNDAGGMYNQSSSPTVTNCTFGGNSAPFGGGMTNQLNSSPTVTNCTFIGNTAGGGGGGMFNANSSSPAVTNCLFSGNTAGSSTIGGFPYALGGGMFNSNNSSPAVSNCTLSGNVAIDGGGMAKAIDGGGMANWSFSSPMLTNCTFSGNSAVNFGGGMHNFNSTSSPTATNCVLWGNVDDAGGSSGGPFMDESAQIHTNSGTPVVNYSIVQGGWTGEGGEGVLDDDPLFVDADGPDNIVGTEDDNLRVRSGSPAMDAGSNGAVPMDVTTDLDGHSRFLCEGVDMGAYEFGIGDYDCNGLVNLADFAGWNSCLTGPSPSGGPYPEGCEHFDSEFDGDVDLRDFARFQATMSASGVPPGNLIGAVSRKTNPSSPDGLCDLSVDLPAGGLITSEMRIDADDISLTRGISELVLTYDGPPGATAVTIEQALCPPPPSYGPYTGSAAMNCAAVGNILTCTFTPGLENARTYRLTVPHGAGTTFVEIRGLIGDTNSDGRVNGADRSGVVGIWTGGVGFSCITDINNDGRTNGADRSLAVGAWTSAARNCAP